MRWCDGEAQIRLIGDLKGRQGPRRTRTQNTFFLHFYCVRFMLYNTLSLHLLYHWGWGRAIHPPVSVIVSHDHGSHFNGLLKRDELHFGQTGNATKTFLSGQGGQLEQKGRDWHLSSFLDGTHLAKGVKDHDRQFLTMRRVYGEWKRTWKGSIWILNWLVYHNLQ